MICVGLALAGAVDLESARARATEAAIDVALAEAEQARARGSTWIAASGGLPSVDLFASASTGAGLTSFGFERPVRTQRAVGATASWSLVSPGSWAAADAARHSARGSAALLEWARVLARRDATVAVADLWSAQGEQAAWAEAAADASRAAEAMDSLAASGLRPPADAARTRATAASLAARELEARGEVAGRCAALQALLREPVDGVCALTPPDGVEPAAARGPHPALRAAEEAVKAARAARTGVLLGRVPEVTASGTAGQYVAGGSSGLGWNAGIEARMPLVSGGAGVGATAQATAERDRAELALEDQARQLEAARVGARARHDAALAGLSALDASERAASGALELVDARHREGLDDLEAWLGARRARDEARVAVALGRAAHLRALAELEAVDGVW